MFIVKDRRKSSAVCNSQLQRLENNRCKPPTKDVFKISDRHGPRAKLGKKSITASDMVGSHQATSIPQNEKRKPTADLVRKRYNVMNQDRLSLYPGMVRSSKQCSGRRTHRHFVHRPMRKPDPPHRAQARSMSFKPGSTIIPAGRTGYCRSYRQ